MSVSVIGGGSARFQDKRIVDGVTEWINPPFEVGVEYRTVERRFGLPVYAKIFDCGIPPQIGMKYVSTGIRLADAKIISVQGIRSQMFGVGLSTMPLLQFRGNNSGFLVILFGFPMIM